MVTIHDAWVDEYGSLFVTVDGTKTMAGHSCLFVNDTLVPEAIRKRMPNVTGLRMRGLRKDPKAKGKKGPDGQPV